MNEQSGSKYHYQGYRPHERRMLHLIVPLAIGFMFGMRKSIMHQRMDLGKRWENGVPPFFAELHRRAHEATEQPAETEA